MGLARVKLNLGRTQLMLITEPVSQMVGTAVHCMIQLDIVPNLLVPEPTRRVFRWTLGARLPYATCLAKLSTIICDCR